uniref:Uncharacterized protein n=1 Tax=Anguilla anguilla TaxID=7936 RepID=A0A0E9TBX8_ANGAN
MVRILQSSIVEVFLSLPGSL